MLPASNEGQWWRSAATKASADLACAGAGAGRLQLTNHAGGDMLAGACRPLGAVPPEESRAGGGSRVQLHMQVRAGGMTAQALYSQHL